MSERLTAAGMFRLLFPALFAAGVASPSFVSAEPEPGSRIDVAPGSVRNQDDTSDASARRVARTFAACVARNRPRLADDVLALPSSSPEQLRRVSRSIGGEDDCMGYSTLQLRSSPRSLAGGMAEYALQGRLANVSLEPVITLTDEQIELRGLRPRNAYEDLALCIVRRDPALVRSFVLTEPATPAEQAAFRGLIVHVGPCVTEGQNLTLNVPGLRSILAVGLYRVLEALQPTSGQR